MRFPSASPPHQISYGVQGVEVGEAAARPRQPDGLADVGQVAGADLVDEVTLGHAQARGGLPGGEQPRMLYILQVGALLGQQRLEAAGGQREAPQAPADVQGVREGELAGAGQPHAQGQGHVSGRGQPHRAERQHVQTQVLGPVVDRAQRAGLEFGPRRREAALHQGFSQAQVFPFAPGLALLLAQCSLTMVAVVRPYRRA